jgi:hypothetical protein
MRSRDVRPFKVEIKTKRRPTAVLPSSIWGDTANLFKTTQDRDSVLPASENRQPVVTAAVETHTPQDGQARRVLPDLRTIDVVAEEEVAIAPVKRASRRQSGAAKPRLTKDQGQHSLQPDAIPDVSSPAQTIHVETSSLSISAGESGDLAPQSAVLPEALQDTILPPVSAPIVAAPGVVRAGRKWSQPGAALPRWEKWKRRLPEVCR